ncbi:MAG: hypothetical protein QM683_04245 [Lacrimispora sp.]
MKGSLAERQGFQNVFTAAEEEGIRIHLIKKILEILNYQKKFK